MIFIDLNKEKSLDSALKKLKYKFSNHKTREELTERREFTKPSVKRRNQIRDARYRQSIQSSETK
jgi:small subunit ribosomal protein S21